MSFFVFYFCWFHYLRYVDAFRLMHSVSFVAVWLCHFNLNDSDALNIIFYIFRCHIFGWNLFMLYRAYTSYQGEWRFKVWILMKIDWFSKSAEAEKRIDELSIVKHTKRCGKWHKNSQCPLRNYFKTLHSQRGLLPFCSYLLQSHRKSISVTCNYIGTTIICMRYALFR